MTLKELTTQEIGLTCEIEDLNQAIKQSGSLKEAFGYICTQGRLLKALRRTQRLKLAAEREVSELERIYQ